MLHKLWQERLPECALFEPGPPADNGAVYVENEVLLESWSVKRPLGLGEGSVVALAGVPVRNNRNENRV